MPKKSSEFKSAFIAALPHTVPVLTGFTVLGMAYGLLMRESGYSTFWAVMMSAVAFCGSMQFVAITLLTAAFNPVQALLLSLMVNARHLFYGLSMMSRYEGLGKIRGFLIYTLCDETFSISSSVQPTENISRKYFYFSISLLDYLYWIFGTFLGGLSGNLITFDTTGLDFVLTALFVVLFLEQMRSVENRVPGIIGIAGTLAALVIFGSDNLVIPAMMIILVILLVRRKIGCR